MNYQLGILGLGSYSTTHYISELNRQYQAQQQAYSTCPFILLNTDFHPINTLLPYPAPALENILKSYLSQLQSFSISHILIPNITLHQTIDNITLQKNIIHPLHLCVDKLQKLKVKRIILLGSKYTMKSSYMAEFFAHHHIQIVTPVQDDFDFIEDFRKQVYHKKATLTTIDKFQNIIKKYAQDYTVVLACTELSIHHLPTPNSIDLVQLQILEAVKVALKS